MSEYQILTNRLEGIKRIQEDFKCRLSPFNAKWANDRLYLRFIRASELGYEIIGRMINLIFDKERIK